MRPSLGERGRPTQKNKQKQEFSARARIMIWPRDSDGVLLPQTYSHRPHQPRNSTFRTLFLGLEAKETLRKFTTILLLTPGKYFSRSLPKEKVFKKEEIDSSRSRVVWYKKDRSENRHTCQLLSLASSYLAHSQNTEKKENRRLGKQPLVPTEALEANRQSSWNSRSAVEINFSKP